MKIYLLSFLLIFIAISPGSSHGGKKHKKDSSASQSDSLEPEGSHTLLDTVNHHDGSMKPDESNVAAELSDFPSLHPLIVHFAIVLIIVAALLQLLNVFFLRNEMAWIICVLLFIGFMAAWLASGKFHPHTHGISEHAKLVLEQHDRWADWTNNTAGIALLVQICYLIFLLVKSGKSVETSSQSTSFLFYRTKRVVTTFIAIVLLVSSYSVIHAGHYGAQLVHIEGIGPQGKYLEIEHNHEH